MRALPFGLAVLLSLVVLFLPASGVPSSPPGTDKVVHLLLFAVLAVTARTAGWRAAPVLAGLLGYAALSEVLQALLPLGRSGDVLDGLVDVAGALLGVGVSALVLRYRDRRVAAGRSGG
ncbi:VanZ family protein [Pseudonocardia nantongensis]|uniref:VanZ family protein n=1 Tax=Pseudonocardia nantongensis TaxID=1181885 RepID=UPI00397B8D73